MTNDTFGFFEKLPEDIRDSFMWLCQDVAATQRKWDFYLELFVKNEEISLLAELALASFNVIFETLQSDIVMSICRLSDPPKSAGQQNLSLESLIENCAQIEGLDQAVIEFKKMCEPVRKLRNKRVGHRDLGTVLKPLENPLPGVSREQIDMILEAAADILNAILHKYDNGQLSFHTMSSGGASSLIFWLKEGKASKTRT